MRFSSMATKRRPSIGGNLRLRTLVPLLAVALFLAGCAVASQPLAFGSAPWHHGESTEYDVLDATGNLIGSATWLWETAPEGWRQSWTVRLEARTDQGLVLLGPDLYPLRSELSVGEAAYVATYGPERIQFTSTSPEGEATTRSLARPEYLLDNGQSLQVHRALPLAEGYATRYTNVIPSTNTAVHTLVQVAGAEAVTVPAGTLEAWRVVMTAGGQSHDAWYAVEPPHLMVKYHNRSAGSQFVLRRWRLAADAPWETALAPGEAPPSAPLPSTLDPDWLRVALAFGIQSPLMILLPLGLGWWVRRRHGIGWRVFAIGAATFVLSQVVHLPLNYALGLFGGGRGVALWPLVWMALVVGLTSGVFEEGARWLVLRHWLRDARGWAAALQFGAGHGGVEAILFGLLAALGMISALAVSLSGQSIPELALYWQTPWYEFILAGLERAFALALHIALSMLVMRAVTSRRLGYFLAAIAAHGAMNFWAVWAMQRLGLLVVELGLALMAAGAVALIVLWRRRGILEVELAQGPSPASGS
jgi:uncharacterized membrane protein YhfC